MPCQARHGRPATPEPQGLRHGGTPGVRDHGPSVAGVGMASTGAERQSPLEALPFDRLIINRSREMRLDVWSDRLFIELVAGRGLTHMIRGLPSRGCLLGLSDSCGRPRCSER